MMRAAESGDYSLLCVFNRGELPLPCACQVGSGDMRFCRCTARQSARRPKMNARAVLWSPHVVRDSARNLRGLWKHEGFTWRGRLPMHVVQHLSAMRFQE